MAAIEHFGDGELDFVPAVFSKYPELVGQVPWIGLRSGLPASPPTRIKGGQHLFGENLVYLKSEVLDADMLSVNNARKLEFILAKIAQAKPKKLVSFDRLGSSNALALAFASSYLQIPMEIHLLRERCSVQAVQDLIEMKKFNAKVELYSNQSSYELKFKWAKAFSGLKKSVVMPRGGHSIESVLGYISAPLELKAQVERGECPEPDLFVMPISRGISLVGLEIGRRMAGLDKMRLLAMPSLGHSKLSGIVLAELATATVNYLNQFLEKPLETQFFESDFNFMNFSSDDLRAERMERFMQRVMELESIEGDLEYSGNALYALHEMILRENIANQNIMFWNSFPGFRNRPMPTPEDLRWMPSWLKQDYTSLLPSALLEKTRRNRQAQKGKGRRRARA